MCYVIITSRGLLWLIMSLIATMLIISAILTPKWLIGPERTKTQGNVTERYTPSVGIYNRCTLIGSRNHCGPFDFEGFATDNDVYPPTWKAAMFFISLGLCIMSISVFLTILGCCRQSICGKSLYTVTGSAQAVAGICSILSLMLHPMGWGAERVQRLCGNDAGPFYANDCSVGMALYSNALGAVLCLASAALSIRVEGDSNKVRGQVERGKRLVCLT